MTASCTTPEPQSSPVTIACPSWCSKSTWEHQQEVESGEQHLIHQSAGRSDAYDWILSMMQAADGTPTPERPGYAPVSLMDGDDVVHPDDAERLALALLEMVAQARGQQGVQR